ncbi:hypothetical protein ACWGIU_08030 [Streptomyces sp. NPDC054840]
MPSRPSWPGSGRADVTAHCGDTRAHTAPKATLVRLYPGRTIEQLDLARPGTGGGGIHSVTHHQQQQPVP